MLPAGSTAGASLLFYSLLITAIVKFKDSIMNLLQFFGNLSLFSLFIRR